MNVAMTTRKGVTYHNALKTDDGYTLICPKYSKTMYLIDMEGHIVNRWRMRYLPAGHGQLLPSGNLLYGGQFKTHEELGLPQEFSAMGGMLMEVDWDGNLIWKAEVPYQHHDFQVMGNGHILYPAQHPKGILPYKISAKLKGGLPETEFKGEVWGDAVFEIDRDGKVVWEWLAYEHLDPEIDFLCPLETRAKWPVINSIWISRDGNILLSLRVANEVVKIEYNTGKVLGRYGRGEIFHQHDARELDNGNITVFDNGNHRRSCVPSYSRVLEIDPCTQEIVWEYKASPPSEFYSAVAGGSERQRNGNNVVCEAQTGRIFEVTAEGELVWEYVSPFRNWDVGQYINMVWRAHRYPRNYPGLKGKDLDPARLLWENRIFGPDAFKKEFTPLIF